MISEGLLMYLPKAIFTAIAEEASKLSGVRRWLFDVASLDAFRRIRAALGLMQWSGFVQQTISRDKGYWMRHAKVVGTSWPRAGTPRNLPPCHRRD
jgi:hypothetical protein